MIRDDPPLLLVGPPVGSPGPQDEVYAFHSVEGLRLDGNGLAVAATYAPPVGDRSTITP